MPHRPRGWKGIDHEFRLRPPASTASGPAWPLPPSSAPAACPASTSTRAPTSPGSISTAAWPTAAGSKSTREGEFAATYRVIAEETAIDGAFSFTAAAPYADFELFIASYFTPHYSPRFALRDNRTHPEGLAWYRKPWYGGNEDESWARDDAAEAIFPTEGAVSHRKITRLTSSGYVRETVDAEPDFPHSGDVGLYFYYEIEHFARAVAGEVSPEPDARDAH